MDNCRCVLCQLTNALTSHASNQFPSVFAVVGGVGVTADAAAAGVCC